MGQHVSVRVRINVMDSWGSFWSLDGLLEGLENQRLTERVQNIMRTPESVQHTSHSGLHWLLRSL